MSASLAQVVTPPRDSSPASTSRCTWCWSSTWSLFVAGRVLDGREDPRADTVLDAGFALLCLAAVYVAVLVVYACPSEFDLIVDMVEIMAVMIGFFALLVVVLLGVELLVGLPGRRRAQAAWRRRPRPSRPRTSSRSRRAGRPPGRPAGTRSPTAPAPSARPVRRWSR